MPPAVVQAISSRLRIADDFPALAAIHVGTDGRVWQRVEIPSEAEEDDAPLDPMNPGSPDWDVFGGAGRWLGTVRLPERFTMMAIRDDALYGVVGDDLDIQRVARLGLAGPLHRGAMSTVLSSPRHDDATPVNVLDAQ